MIPLIPLAVSLAPELARWLFGEKASETTEAVAKAVQTVTGTSDGAAAQQVLARDPSASGQLRVRLAQIAAEAEAAARKSELNKLSAGLADVANARAQTIGLARVHSQVQWAPVTVSALVLVTFGVVMWAALTRVLPQGSETVVNMLLGTLAAMATSVVTYWVGSSAGSAAKTEMLMHAVSPRPSTNTA